MNDSYCPLIFHGIYIERSSNYQTAVAPCCISKMGNPTNDPIDFENNTHLNAIRNDSASNKKPAACNACWSIEQLGGESKRQVTIDDFIKRSIPLDQKVKLYQLDYNTLPICNAKCIICSSKYSSLWAAHNGNKNMVFFDKTQNHINTLDMDSIKTIYFNGGEPLLTDEHVLLLSQVNNPGECNISYNTNGSCLPSLSVLNLWAKFKSTNLFFSIDAVDDKFEEIRTPLKWEVVSKNIEILNSTPGLKIGCSYTVGSHNVFEIEKTIQWFAKLKNFDPLTQFHVHTVSSENRWSLENSSKEDLTSFLQEIDKFRPFYWYTSIHNMITKIYEEK